MNTQENQTRLSYSRIALQLEESIEKGLSYLKSHQYPNGEFCCYFSPDDAMQEWCVPNSSVFPTALIVNCLISLENNSNHVEQINKRAIPFFEYQMMRGGVYNYFTKWNPSFKLCPPDIDDTVFINNFMRTQNVTFPDPLPLILANQSKSGLFYTWFTLRINKSRNLTYWLLLIREFKNPIQSLIFWKRNESKRNDIDAVVNANILYYLGDKVNVKPIMEFLLKIIKDNQEEDCDKWYRNPFTFYYFFSRNVKKGFDELAVVNDIVIDKITSKVHSDGRIGQSALDTALGITTLINLNYRGPVLIRSIEFLLKSQQETGEWARRIFYYGGPKKIVGFGSEELSTSFCIEALANYQKLQENET